MAISRAKMIIIGGAVSLAGTVALLPTPNNTGTKFKVVCSLLDTYITTLAGSSVYCTSAGGIPILIFDETNKFIGNGSIPEALVIDVFNEGLVIDYHIDAQSNASAMSQMVSIVNEISSEKKLTLKEMRQVLDDSSNIIYERNMYAGQIINLDQIAGNTKALPAIYSLLFD